METRLLAPSLFAVLAVAKAAMVMGGADLTPATMAAMLWQDAALALAFLAFELLVRRRHVVLLAYWAIAIVATIDVPVARVLGAPLTRPMLRATSTTLSDSIFHAVTLTNVVWMGAVLALAVVVSRGVVLGRSARRVVAAAGAVVVLIGNVAARRVDVGAREWNGVTALARTSLPRVRSNDARIDWRASPADTAAADAGLHALRGVAQGRNVVVVVLESTGAGYLAPWGAPQDPAPNLSALTRDGLTLDDAYAAYPESVKGLAATLAGRAPRFDMSPTALASGLDGSLATALRTAGYTSLLVHSGRFMYLGMDTIVAALRFDRAEDAGDIGGVRESSFGVDEPAAVDRILRWIDARPRGTPFLAVYLPIAGHHPYAHSANVPFPSATEVDRYRNAVFEGDAALGALLAGLRSRRLADSTLIVVVADHGEAFGQHRGNYGHTLAIYEENVRVPMVFVAPGSPLRGRIRGPASLTDVPSTILDLLGLPPAGGADGESILSGRRRMALFHTDYARGLLGLRDGCFKTIHDVEADRTRLFDLCNDPAERVDVAAEHRERVELYRDRLLAWAGRR